MTQAEMCAPPRPVLKKPKTALPAGACDCHFHIFDAPSQQVPERSYTAPHAALSEYKQLQDRLGVQRSVIVQPSIYGRDNRTTVSVCQSDPDMRAVVVIDDTVSDDVLRRYADAGVVGCRLNLLFASGVDSGSLTQFAERLAEFGWHLQILADISQFAALETIIPTLPVPVIFDHMGHMPTSMGTDHAAFRLFLKYLAEGILWVKLSGAYRVTSASDCRYDDVHAFVSALVAANPDQLVWGTDWPHPQIKGAMPDDTDLLNQLLEWVPNTEHRQKIFVDNPAVFYGF